MSPKRVLVLSLVVLVVTTPLLAQEGMGDYAQGRMDGERDGKGNPLWLLAGFGCGIFGAGAAYFMKPSPPVHVLIGKPSGYVLGYTEGYQSKARNMNTTYACIGWVAAAVVLVATDNLGAGY